MVTSDVNQNVHILCNYYKMHSKVTMHCTVINQAYNLVNAYIYAQWLLARDKSMSLTL